VKIQEKLKGKNGITLIALVVTIIVLIILVGVSISLVLGDNGIVTKAKEAKQNMQVAANEEQTSLANLEVAIENEGGASGGSTQTINPDLAKLKAGDYIKYDTGVASVGENGVITCRVLYEASSTYGLQIISDKNVGPDITLGGSTFEEGKTSYNNAIETLNNNTIGAEKYLNTTYAVDARCIGSIPLINLDGSFTEKNKGTETTVTLPSVSDGWVRPGGWTSDDTGCYDTDTNYTTDLTQMTNANIKTTGELYWMASRYVYLTSNGCDFNVRRVLDSGDLDKYKLCYVDCDSGIRGYSRSNGLRPCFSLRSDIKITGGDGQSETTAYTMRYLEEKNAMKEKAYNLVYEF